MVSKARGAKKKFRSSVDIKLKLRTALFSAIATLVFYSISTLVMTKTTVFRHYVETFGIPEIVQSGLTILFIIGPGLALSAFVIYALRKKYPPSDGNRDGIKNTKRILAERAVYAILGISAGLLITVQTWGFFVGISKRALQKEISAKGFSFDPPPNDLKLPELDNFVSFVVSAQDAFKDIHKKSFEHLVNGKSLKMSESDILTDVLEILNAGEKIDPWLNDQAAIILAKKGKVLQALIDNVNVTTFSWGTDWNINSFDLGIPRMSELLLLTRAICIQAILHSNSGNRSKSFSDFHVVFRLAEVVGSQPTWASNMISGTILRIGLKSIRGLYPEGIPKGDLDVLSDMINVEVYKKHRVATVEYEMIVRPDQLLDFLDGEMRNSSFLSRWMVGIFHPYLTIDAIQYQRFGLRIAEATRLGFSQVSAELEQIEKVVRNEGMIFASVGMPSIKSLYSRSVSLAADAELLAFIANDDFSSMDPFSDEPLKIHMEGKKVWLYSVGPDQIDDRNGPYSNRDGTGDISWRVHPSVYASWDL